jgi:Ser/Thr protein kinase RdoA (MazF antagonist)
VDTLLLIIDALARLHATFWNDPILNDERIGLCDSARILNGTSLPVARKRPIPNNSNSPIAEWVEEGWEIMADLVDRDVFEQMYGLIEDPRSLFAALDRYPYTLLHGDFRDANLAVLPQERLVAFDWQFAARSLMTIDLAWFTGNLASFNFEDGEPMSRAQADLFYRQRLETYLQKRFDDQHWEAMLDLGYLVNALRTTCLSAYFSKHGDNPEWRKSERAEVMEKGQQVRNALRWL